MDKRAHKGHNAILIYVIITLNQLTSAFSLKAIYFMNYQNYMKCIPNNDSELINPTTANDK